MADHPRKIVRDKIVELLIAANTVAATRVYPNRVKPVGKTEMPLILVYIKSEPTERDRELPYIRSPRVLIEGLRKVGDDLDDKLDELSKEIEMTFQDDQYLTGLTNDFKLTATDINLVEEGGTLLGSIVLTYDAPYRTRALT